MAARAPARPPGAARVRRHETDETGAQATGGAVLTLARTRVGCQTPDTRIGRGTETDPSREKTEEPSQTIIIEETGSLASGVPTATTTGRAGNGSAAVIIDYAIAANNRLQSLCCVHYLLVLSVSCV